MGLLHAMIYVRGSDQRDAVASLATYVSDQPPLKSFLRVLDVKPKQISTVMRPGQDERDYRKTKTSCHTVWWVRMNGITLDCF